MHPPSATRFGTTSLANSNKRARRRHVGEVEAVDNRLPSTQRSSSSSTSGPQKPTITGAAADSDLSGHSLPSRSARRWNEATADGWRRSPL